MKNFIKKLIKTFVLDPVHSIKVSFLTLLKIIDFPVPANSSMRKTTASGSITRYFTTGIECYMPIVVMAEKYGLNLRRGDLDILDFGCGVGRLLLQFTRNYKNNNYYACDIDDTSVNFIKRNYKNVLSYVNDHKPPLVYQDNTFDLIYSLSIFSHLNLEDQESWLAELSRVTKKDGFLFLTIEGSHSIKWWLFEDFNMAESDAQNKLNNEGFIFKEYDGWEKITKTSNILRTSSQLVGVKSAYGSMALSKDFVYKNWNKYNLEVIEILEGVVGTRQDLVILKKTSA